MNISKDRKCMFGHDHAADVSLVYVLSTIGVKPRQQKAMKALHVCFAHLSRVALVTADAEKAALGDLQSLTDEKQAVTRVLGQPSDQRVSVSARDAALAMNHRRWHVLKKKAKSA